MDSKAIAWQSFDLLISLPSSLCWQVSHNRRLKENDNLSDQAVWQVVTKLFEVLNKHVTGVVYRYHLFDSKRATDSKSQNNH